MRDTAIVSGGKPIIISLQSISGVNAINRLVAFYDIHGGKREVLFFYFVPEFTRETNEVAKTTIKLSTSPSRKLIFHLSFTSFNDVDAYVTTLIHQCYITIHTIIMSSVMYTTEKDNTSISLLR
jgi:hypothetical protein